MITDKLDSASLGRLRAGASPYVHIITIATKPDIIKQAPVYLELRHRGEPVLLCHTGQHHDHRYSGAMLDEFGLSSDLHLAISGGLQEKVAQIVERFGGVLAQLSDAGLTPVPYIHGDTLTSMAIGTSSYLSRVSCVHVEAGIRTLTPRAEVYASFLADHHAGTFSWDAYRKVMQDRGAFEQGSQEPYPEQFNTRVSDAATGFHAAPVELDREFLLAEGFPASTIDVVGNTVVDATAAARRDAARATVFATYPMLRGNRFIRICIHRRENTADRQRFLVLLDAMEELVRRGRRVLFISLFGTEEAIDRFGQRARIEALAAGFPTTFLYSPVWPNYRDVIAAMLECAVVATDSGSMQEEMNILGVPCVTLRFGTDRAESVLAGANVLAPPVDSSFVVAVIEAAMEDASMRAVPNLYGTDASAKAVNGVLARLTPRDGLFLTEERRLGIRGGGAT